MIFKEKYCNLFNENIEKAMYAHCISADAEMGAGIAVDFNKHFHLSSLKNRDNKVGECVFLNNVFNLITKSKYNGKPTYLTFEKSLIEMKKQCIEKNVSFLIIPKIGCGRDRLQWGIVRDKIQEIFNDLEITILVCKQ